jgi:hypothetical protein
METHLDYSLPVAMPYNHPESTRKRLGNRAWCPYCGHASTEHGVDLHVKLSRGCKAKRAAEFALLSHAPLQADDGRSQNRHQSLYGRQDSEDNGPENNTYNNFLFEPAPAELPMDVEIQEDARPPSLTTSVADAGRTPGSVNADVKSTTSSRRWKELFPALYEAGKVLRQGTTEFEKIRAAQDERIAGRYEGFKDQAEWELACFMVKHMGQNAMDELLNLEIVSKSSLRLYPPTVPNTGSISFSKSCQCYVLYQVTHKFACVRWNVQQHRSTARKSSWRRLIPYRQRDPTGHAS